MRNWASDVHKKFTTVVKIFTTYNFCMKIPEIY